MAATEPRPDGRGELAEIDEASKTATGRNGAPA